MPPSIYKATMDPQESSEDDEALERNSHERSHNCQSEAGKLCSQASGLHRISLNHSVRELGPELVSTAMKNFLFIPFRMTAKQNAITLGNVMRMKDS